MSCPRCGSNRANVFSLWKTKTAEQYNLKTGELLDVQDLNDSRVAVKTYRTAECANCGAMFRLNNKQYEKMRW